MQRLRRYASLIAALVFVTSGPLAAWHVAREAVPRSPCAMAAGVATLAAAHGVESVPDGTGCIACHLLQQVRVPVAAVVAGVPASAACPSSLGAFDQTPRDLAVADHLPARAPPPALA